MHREIIGTIISLLMIAVGFAVIVWFMLAFNMYFADVRNILFRLGNLEFFIYSCIFVFVFLYILRKLLLWEVHLQFGPRKERKVHKIHRRRK